MKKENKITGSVFAKIVAFFVLAISVIVGLITVFASFMLYDLGAYDYKYQENSVQVVAREMMVNHAWNEMHELRMAASPLYSYGISEEQLAKTTEQLEEKYEDRNFAVEIYQGDTLLWGNYTQYETPYSFRYTYSEWVTVPVEKQETGQELPEDKNDSYVKIPEGNGAFYLEQGKKDGTDSAIASTQVPNGALEIQEKAEVLEDESATVEEKETAALEIEETATVEEETTCMLKEFTCRLYVKPELSLDDEYSTAFRIAGYLSEGRYQYPVAAAVCVILVLIAFIFLMCSAGHKNGREGICSTVITCIHFDFLTVVFGAVAVMGLVVIVDLINSASLSELLPFGLMVLVGCAEVVWGTIYCMEFAIRLKLGNLWQHTLIAAVCRGCLKLIKAFWKGIKALVKGFPLILNVAIIYLAVCIAEFLGLCIWGRSGELVIVWFLEKMVLFAVVMYIALVCKKLQAGSKALAEGDLSFQLDTSMMVLDFKEHGENLNQIGQGISRAVEARMKSEHLKTELITNVSHDLKTPLTSIINYADLLAHEALRESVDGSGKLMVANPDAGSVAENLKTAENSKIAEYAEVLLRQAKRLKKLLEDLVEASKATTGALEVNLEQCEIGVLLSQAVGEYEQRFAEKQLNLIVRQPEEPVKIMADGRHLWRVFDNLLNNISKYAQENSRVYLSVEKQGQQEKEVAIIFRNMSKYALDISAEELEERFVRGDKSRHMEGNGLGLSIAKSLVELQHGRMEVVTDGDLFKVTLYFKAIEEK